MTDADIQRIHERLGWITDAGDEGQSIETLRDGILYLLQEVDRLTAITSSVRRCHACHAEVIQGRGGADFEDEETGMGIGEYAVEFRPPFDFSQKEPTE